MIDKDIKNKIYIIVNEAYEKEDILHAVNKLLDLMDRELRKARIDEVLKTEDAISGEDESYGIQYRQERIKELLNIIE